MGSEPGRDFAGLLRIRDDVVRETLAVPIRDRDVGGTASPAAVPSARHDMHVIVRNLLQADDAVVLINGDSLRRESLHHGAGYTLSSLHNRGAFLLRKIQERGGVTPGHNQHMARFELPPVQKSSR